MPIKMVIEKAKKQGEFSKCKVNYNLPLTLFGVVQVS